MYLTDEEKQMLDGTEGYAVQKSMQILVALGESFGAENMVPVASCHLPGASYKLLGEAGLMFVKEMGEKGGRVRVFTTTNPTSCDNSMCRRLAIDKQFAQAQAEVTQAYQRLGIVTCGSCTPYLIGNAPRLGQHAAWGESSAVVYVNAVLGGRTNREGGPSALAAAITGRTPNCGMHLDENRKGSILVHVPEDLCGIEAFGTLGYAVGKIAQTAIPVFDGIRASVSSDELKSLGSALATSGAVASFHVVGITPEAPDLKCALGGKKPETELHYDELMRSETIRHLTLTDRTDDIDWLYVGCPQCSLQEVRYVAELLKGKKVAGGVDFWVCTSTPIKELAIQMGYAQIIEEAGALLVCQTCPAHAPHESICQARHYQSLTTDSAKMAHYAAGEVGIPTHYGTTEAVVRAAITKRWEA